MRIVFLTPYLAYSMDGTMPTNTAAFTAKLNYRYTLDMQVRFLSDVPYPFNCGLAEVKFRLEQEEVATQKR